MARVAPVGASLKMAVFRAIMSVFLPTLVHPHVHTVYNIYIALWRQHVGRKLQIHDLGHLRSTLSRPSTTAATDVIPGA